VRQTATGPASNRPITHGKTMHAAGHVHRTMFIMDRVPHCSCVTSWELQTTKPYVMYQSSLSSAGTTTRSTIATQLLCLIAHPVPCRIQTLNHNHVAAHAISHKKPVHNKLPIDYFWTAVAIWWVCKPQSKQAIERQQSNMPIRYASHNTSKHAVNIHRQDRHRHNAARHYALPVDRAQSHARYQAEVTEVTVTPHRQPRSTSHHPLLPSTHPHHPCAAPFLPAIHQ
jgi:hypothetical protein